MRHRASTPVPPNRNMKIESPKDLLFDQLRDLRSVEEQLVKALPELVEKAEYPGLVKMLRSHAAETENQLARLDGLFERYAINTRTDKCKAMAGLLKGGACHLKKVSNPRTRDLMMVAHCLRIEQYEIAAYEITVRLARQTGFEPVEQILNELVARERAAKSQLEQIEPAIFGLSQEEEAA